MPLLNSSNIADVEYDADTKRMVVSFTTGGRYEYRDVSKEVYDDFVGSASPGGYFYRHVRNLYSGSRVG